MPSWAVYLRTGAEPGRNRNITEVSIDVDKWLSTKPVRPSVEDDVHSVDCTILDSIVKVTKKLHYLIFRERIL